LRVAPGPGRLRVNRDRSFDAREQAMIGFAPSVKCAAWCDVNKHRHELFKKRK
jgi:hypothetical protein